jgi:hypothetical protein
VIDCGRGMSAIDSSQCCGVIPHQGRLPWAMTDMFLMFLGSSMRPRI